MFQQIRIMRARVPATTLRTESHVVCRWGDGPEQGHELFWRVRMGQVSASCDVVTNRNTQVGMLLGDGPEQNHKLLRRVRMGQACAYCDHCQAS